MTKFDLSISGPIVTIIGGIIAAFIIMFIIPYLGYVIGPLVGGFIATYFSKEKEIIYGLFVGIGAMILLFFYPSSGPISIIDIIKYIFVFSIISIIPAIIGSFIGKRINDHFNQTSDTKSINNP